MDLTFSQYTGAVVKETANQVRFYLNNYDQVLNTGLKTDIIRINGSTAQPTWSFTDRGSHQASVVSATWSGGIFTLTVQHNGGLDITVNCAGTATGRLTAYTPSTVVSPVPPPVYQGPIQHEAEHFDFKSIAGNTANGANGAIRNYTGQGYLQFGTNAAASIRDTLYITYPGTYQLQTRYALTGGNVGTVNLYVNGINVATPSFTQTGSTNTWAVNTQTVTLNAGFNTIELRANAAAPYSVYVDNIVARPVSSSGNIIQENSTGFCTVDGTVDTNNAGYTGTGFANTNNAAGNGINWKIDFAAIGTSTFTFRYASTDYRVGNLFINGSLAAATINFPSTGSWTTWSTVTVYANTAAGLSDVRLEATGASGLPNVDYIQVAGGTAANCATAVTTYAIQENETGFCSVDGTIDNNYLGFVGSGFANTNNAIGTGISYRINAASAGTKTFTFRYASTDSRPGRLLINGTQAIASIAFPATGSWTSWSTVTVTASTPAGIVDIRLEATAATGLGNMDYLAVTNGTPVACQTTLLALNDNPGTPTSTARELADQSHVKESTIRLSPNPAHNEITVSLSAPWKAGDQLILCDAAGKPVINRTINRNTEVLPIAKLPAGNYFIKVINSKAEQETLQFIKK